MTGIDAKRLLRFFTAWYIIWFGVGLFSIGFQWPSFFYHVEDMLFMVLAGVVVLLHVAIQLGWHTALKAFLWIAVFASTVEYVGAVTGFPFGDYHYTAKFGPRIAGELPVAIPFAWWVVVFPLHWYWSTLLHRKPASVVLVPIAVGLSAVAIDLALEPVATVVRAYWVWTGDNGIYYGVPLSNFIAWFIVAMMMSIGLHLIVTGQVRKVYTEATTSLMTPLLVLLAVLITFLVGSVLARQWLAAGIIVVDGGLLLFAVFALLFPRKRGGRE